jgi:sulfite exporter TauE/SafE
VGHAAGALVLGIAAVTLRDALPWGGLSVWAERAVGALLVVLGVWTIRRAAVTVVHDHAHAHADGSFDAGGAGRTPDTPHTHLHVHQLATRHDPATVVATRHRHEHAALGIGFLHGLAGFGHLWAALPALALPRSHAILYLAAYGLGTLAAMSIFSSVLGSVGVRASASGTRILQGALRAAGAVAVVVGVWWIWGGGL